MLLVVVVVVVIAVAMRILLAMGVVTSMVCSCAWLIYCRIAGDGSVHSAHCVHVGVPGDVGVHVNLVM